MPRAWPENPDGPDCHDDELSIADAAIRAGCEPLTLRRAAARAVLKVRRDGRRIFVKIASLRRWMARRR